MTDTVETIFARIERGEGREIRVASSDFKGRTYLNVREWFNNGDGWRPGKGIALRPGELAQVASALDAAAGIAPEADPTAEWSP